MSFFLEKKKLSLLYKLGIIESCPNCDSAWSGGHLEPEKIKWCLVCGNGPAGWVWGWIVPRFIKNRIIRNRYKKYKAQNHEINCLS